MIFKQINKHSKCSDRCLWFFGFSFVSLLLKHCPFTVVAVLCSNNYAHIIEYICFQNILCEHIWVRACNNDLSQKSFSIYLKYVNYSVIHISKFEFCICVHVYSGLSSIPSLSVSCSVCLSLYFDWLQWQTDKQASSLPQFNGTIISLYIFIWRIKEFPGHIINDFNCVV